MNRHPCVTHVRTTTTTHHTPHTTPHHTTPHHTSPPPPLPFLLPSSSSPLPSPPPLLPPPHTHTPPPPHHTQTTATTTTSRTEFKPPLSLRVAFFVCTSRWLPWRLHAMKRRQPDVAGIASSVHGTVTSVRRLPWSWRRPSTTARDVPNSTETKGTSLGDAAGSPAGARAAGEGSHGRVRGCPSASPGGGVACWRRRCGRHHRLLPPEGCALKQKEERKVKERLERYNTHTTTHTTNNTTPHNQPHNQTTTPNQHHHQQHHTTPHHTTPHHTTPHHTTPHHTTPHHTTPHHTTHHTTPHHTTPHTTPHHTTPHTTPHHTTTRNPHHTPLWFKSFCLCLFRDSALEERQDW